MSTQPTETAATPSEAEGPNAAKFTQPYRQLAAFVLLSVPAFYLIFAFADLFLKFDNWADNFTRRAGSISSSMFNSVADNYLSVWTVLLPILAVLVATHGRTLVAQAKIITIIAAIEYAVAALFGFIALFAAFIGDLNGDNVTGAELDARYAIEALVLRAAVLALILVGLFVIFKLYTGLFQTAPQAQQYGYQYGQQYPQAQQQYAQQQYAQQQYAAQQAQQQQYAAAQQAQQAQQQYSQQQYGQQAQAGYGQQAAGTTGAAGQAGYASGGYGYGAQQYQAQPEQQPTSSAGTSYSGYGSGYPAQSDAAASSPFASYATSSPASAPPASAPPASAPPASAPPAAGQYGAGAEGQDRTQLIPPGESPQSWSPPQR